MSAADGRRDVLRHIAGHRYTGRCAVVTDANRAVGNFAVVHRHRVDVGQRKRLAHDGDSLAVGVCHLARLCGWELVGDVTNLDVQRLCITIDN